MGIDGSEGGNLGCIVPRGRQRVVCTDGRMVRSSLWDGSGLNGRVELLCAAALPRALSAWRSLEVYGPVRTEARVGCRPWLTFEQPIERQMVSDGLLVGRKIARPDGCEFGSTMRNRR